MTDDGSQLGPSSPLTVAALETLYAHIALGERYQAYINDVVLPRGSSPQDQAKLGKRHQDTLRSNACQYVLLLIWKESPFVTHADLRAIGSGKAFSETPLNCNSLGVHMAAKKEKVGASTQWVQKVVDIATAYQLVGRRPSLGRPIELIGTQYLHDMFVAIGACSELALAAVPPPHPPSLTL